MRKRNEEIRQRFTAALKMADMKLSELARAVDMPLAHLSQIRNGWVVPLTPTGLKIAAGLKTDPANLWGEGATEARP